MWRSYGKGNTGTSNAVTVHLGNNCPDGLEKIVDEARCADAAKLLDAEVVALRAKSGVASFKTEIDAGWPKGCYRCSNTPGCSRVSAQATNHAQMAVICKYA